MVLGRQTIHKGNMDSGDKCHTCHSGSAVCMHVWNKFDLLPPTPPRSPVHDLSVPGIEDIDLYDDTEFFLREEDVLATMKQLFPESPPLQSDPMWSGSIGNKESSEKNVKSQSCENLVNPIDVFPYPMTSSLRADNYMTETRVHSLGTETPSDSEEEIDVVTVEKQLLKAKEEPEEIDPAEIRCTTTIPVRIVNTENSRTVKSPVKSTLTLKVKVENNADTEHHNYCLVNTNKRARSHPVSPMDSPVPSKRTKHQISAPELHRAFTQKIRSGHSSSSSSRNSSDSEECIGEGGKRNQHNVLERKRRNDLKYSFFHLRDIVPDLSHQERAPKVLILKKSADYIHKLNSESKRLEQEKEVLATRREQLRRTLNKLQINVF